MKQWTRTLNDYKDIIDIPRHDPIGRTRMPMEKRAAQFSPFAALTGYEDAISDAVKRTEEEVENRNKGS
jgi:hypothetical protein